MKTARDTGLLFHRYTVQMLRNPVWLFVGFSTPVLYLVLFTPLLKELPGVRGFPTGSVLELFLPGILSLLAFASGSQRRLRHHLRVAVRAHRAAPGHPGQPVRHPDRADPVGTGDDDRLRRVVVAVGVGFGFTVHWAGLLVLTVLLWVLATLMAAFSTATALITKDISSFAAIINGINLPLLLLAGVLLPISLGPLWLRILAHFNPLYYLVVASRSLAAGHLGDAAVWQAFAVLVPLCASSSWSGPPRVFRRAVS